MTGPLYVPSVTDHVPHRLLLRDHIAMELRGHIAERIGRGQPIEKCSSVCTRDRRGLW